MKTKTKTKTKSKAKTLPMTLPLPAKPTLPPLRCRILKDGVFVSVSEQPDPRDAFCEAFNRHPANRTGLTAEPMIESPLPPLCCGIFDDHGNLQRITEMPDPRERYCQTFGEFAIGAVAIPLAAGEVEAARKYLAAKQEGGAA